MMAHCNTLFVCNKVLFFCSKVVILYYFVDKERLSLMELVRNPRPPQKVLEVGTRFARRALEHNATVQLLADTAQHFDLVVAEWFFTGLLAP